jgi:hypothetical protein
MAEPPYPYAALFRLHGRMIGFPLVGVGVLAMLSGVAGYDPV